MRLFLLLLFVCSLPLCGATFVLQDVDTHTYLVQEGDVATYKSPYCSFNIVLSLIGFDTQILIDPENPVWPFQEAYRKEGDFFSEPWKEPHTPTAWMKNSCVWFSQELTRKLGMKTFADYIVAFRYGNQNLSGDTGKANGLTHAWLGSSLRLSALDQVHFITRLLHRQLPVSEHACACAEAILFVETLPNGMKLFGKTGGGSFAFGHDRPESRIGWFVGWVEKGERRLAFAYAVEGNESGEQPAGPYAREQLKRRLLALNESAILHQG